MFGSDYDAGRFDFLTSSPSESGGVAELPLPGEANIGREFAPDLVAQAQTKLCVTQAGADPLGGHVLRGEVEFDARLQSHSLYQAQVVPSLQPAQQVALVGQEQCRLGLEPVGRQPFDPDRRIAARRIRAKVVAEPA